MLLRTWRFQCAKPFRRRVLFPVEPKIRFRGLAGPRSSRGARAAAESGYVFPAQEIAVETASLDSVMFYRNNPVRDRQHPSVCDF
jgi:hypothetical protein